MLVTGRCSSWSLWTTRTHLIFSLLLVATFSPSLNYCSGFSGHSSPLCCRIIASFAISTCLPSCHLLLWITGKQGWNNFSLSTEELTWPSTFPVLFTLHIFSLVSSAIPSNHALPTFRPVSKEVLLCVATFSQCSCKINSLKPYRLLPCLHLFLSPSSCSSLQAPVTVALHCSDPVTFFSFFLLISPFFFFSFSVFSKCRRNSSLLQAHTTKEPNQSAGSSANKSGQCQEICLFEA